MHQTLTVALQIDFNIWRTISALITLISADSEIIQNETTTKSLEKATIQVIKQFYVNRTSSINIRISSKNIRDELKQKDIVSNILNKLSTEIAYYLHSKETVSSINLIQSFNLMFIDNYESFR